MVSYSDNFDAYAAFSDLASQNSDWKNVGAGAGVMYTSADGGNTTINAEDGNIDICGYSGVSWSSDHSAQISTCAVMASNWAYAGMGPAVRCQGERSGNAYAFQVINSNAGNSHEIIRYDAGSPTVLTSVVSVLASDCVAKLVANGTTITAYINDVQILQTTDATYSGGSPGIFGRGSRYGVDYFVGEDLTSPPSSGRRFYIIN